MSIYLLETWFIKPEDEEKHGLLWTDFVEYMNQNRELFTEIRSMKLCRRVSGDDSVTHIQVVEFDSLSDKEIMDERLSNNKGCQEFNRKLMFMKDVKTTTEILCQPFIEYV